MTGPARPELLHAVPTRQELAAVDAFVVTDLPWQGLLRWRQSMWREGLGLPPGVRGDRALGSRLPAGDRASNFLTAVVCEAVERAIAQPGALVSAPRVYENLLSSQPLAFNLFAEVAADPELRTAVGRALWPDLFHEVSSVEFEWSPGRRDPRYLGNRSAFDVAFRGTDPDGRSALVGIEVKYHEDMSQDPGSSAKNTRYQEVAERSGVFREPLDPALRELPLRQVWYDHLLALSMQQVGADEPGHVDRSRFVLLAPEVNPKVIEVDTAYRNTLSDSSTYERRTLEDVVAVVGTCTTAPWVTAFADRYL